MPSLSSLGSSNSDVNVRIGTSVDNSGIDDAQKGIKGLGSSADEAGTHFLSLGNVAKLSLAALAAGGAAAAAALIPVIKSAADLQQTSQSFQVLTGNVDIANKLFGQLAVYANSTPFEFPQIAKAGQTLLGFGIKSDDVFGKIKILGDIAAATGADFNSLALVFGQVNASGKLMGQDALQLINNSIPIYNILAKKMGITTGEVKDKMEQGAISADIFNQALEDVTKKGGFAFNGVNVLANSFNGRMSTLSDTVLDFGRQLLGVHVDPQLGLAIDKGGLFDRFSNLIPVISSGLGTLIPTFVEVIDAIMQFGQAAYDVGVQVGEYLGPKLVDLWGTVSEDLVPALALLWQNILLPLIDVLGTGLVVAIGGVIDAINFLVPIISGLIDWMAQNKDFVVQLGIAFGILAIAMNFNSVSSAFGTAMDGVMAKVAATKGSLVELNTFMTGFGGFGIIAAAGVIAFAQIYQAAEDAKAAIIDMQNAMNKSNESANALVNTANQAYKDGRITKDRRDTIVGQAYAGQKSIQDSAAKANFWDGLGTGVSDLWKSAIGANASGSNSWSGGPTWVGENGPEIIDAPQGSKIYTNSDSQKMMGSNTQTITVQNLNLNSADAVREFFDMSNRDTQLRSMGLTPLQGRI